MSPRLTPALASLLLIPSAAFAAEGMPQLDFHNPLTIAQIVWGAIIFLAFYLLLARWGLPQVERVIESRAASIAADLDAARVAKAQSDAAVAAVAKAAAEARAQAQAQINTATATAQQEAAARAQDVGRRVEAQLKEAEGQIHAARAAAMGALRDVARETAETVVQRLAGTAPDARALDGAVGAALAARGIS
jgi:F-type H+-transporting ATPase subunit b